MLAGISQRLSCGFTFIYLITSMILLSAGQLRPKFLHPLHLLLSTTIDRKKARSGSFVWIPRPFISASRLVDFLYGVVRLRYLLTMRRTTYPLLCLRHNLIRIKQTHNMTFKYTNTAPVACVRALDRRTSLYAWFVIHSY